MRASVHADGMTCRSRYIPVVTARLGGTERSMDGPQTDIVNVGNYGCDGHNGAMTKAKASAQGSGTGDINWARCLVVDCGKRVHYWSFPNSRPRVGDSTLL